MHNVEFVLKPPLLTGSNETKKRAEIKNYFNNSWGHYESLFKLIISDSAYYLRPEPLRHPLIFYYGHTAVFCVNKLILGKYIDTRIDPSLESICAIGVDEMSWDDVNVNKQTWPTLASVKEYRNKVFKLMNNLIDTMPLDLPIIQSSLAWIILMCIEHEKIHLETSSVLIRMLDLKYVEPNQYWQACKQYGATPQNQLIHVDKTSLTLGKDDPTYGWDNEYGQKNCTVLSFKASKLLVSNGEYLQFIDEGGYEKPLYWTAEGKKWLTFTKSKMPRFWEKKSNTFYQRNLTEEILLPLNWPVEVNYLEAKAFCNWKSQKTKSKIRLPIEAEWHHLRNRVADDLPTWGQTPGNINLDHYASSCPVDLFTHDEFCDLIGNVWQWTESEIDGYNGFSVHPLYDDFSTPTFDGKHNLIKGGSWISTGNEACKNARYAFRRHFFQHAGFRYIQSDSDVDNKQTITVKEVDIANQLHTHYGKDKNTTSNPLVDCINTIKPHLALINKSRALDLGCSVGRATFELANIFNHVDGIDFTARHIQHALQMRDKETIRYELATEGNLRQLHEITLSRKNEAKFNKNINFTQGDAHNLKSHYSNYDFILCNFLLTYLYDPPLFIKEITKRINSNGILAINSNYQWDKHKSNPEKWLGGFKKNAENYSTLDGLQENLAPNFRLIDCIAMNRSERINNGLYHLVCSELSLWERCDV